jgi:hypothetical protein
MSDLRNFLISLAASVIAFYVVLGLNRYWSVRSLRSLEQQIADAETQVQRIESLRSSDRAVLVFGFRILFALFTLISLVMIVPPLMSLAHLQIRPDDLLSILIWFTVGLIAFWAGTLLKKIDENPAAAAENMRLKIERLRARRERMGKGEA